MKNITTDVFTTTTTSKTQACYHCHDDCKETVIDYDKKAFCCEGCRMVYSILNENDLCTYYDIDAQAGVSLKGKKQESYAYLEDPEVKSKLIHFTDGISTKLTFYLPSMHCSSCIWLLEHLQKLDSGIVQAKVNFLKKEVYITFLEAETKLSTIVGLLATIGYAPEINLGDLEQQRKKPVNRMLYYQIGLAGFCFGNIMLLSFPEYLGLDKVVEQDFYYFFGYLNLILALPVLLFSARDYFISAWAGIRQGILNIDVPLVVGLLGVFGRSAYEVLTHTGTGYFDSFSGLVLFLLAGKWFQQTTFHTLSFERDYKSYFPVAANVLQEDKTEKATPLDKLCVGDTIMVRHGELIPSDGILIKGQGNIDYSFVTGESEPVIRNSGDKVFAGGRQMGELITFQLTRKVSQSYLTQLWNEDTFQQKNKSLANSLADQAARFFTYFVLIISFLTLVYWAPRDIATALNACTAVLIVACPCTLALAIPFTLGNLMRILGKNQFYVKNTETIEALARANMFVFDKTGTLTYNNQKNEVFYEGQPLTEQEKIAIKSLTSQSSHPISRSISAFFGDFPVQKVVDFKEVIGEGVSGWIDKNFVRVGLLTYIMSDKTTKRQALKGTRVAINGELKGNFTLQYTYRKGLAAIVEQLRHKFSLAVLSGDNDREKAILAPLFGDENVLHFFQTPKDKLNFVKKSQQKKHTFVAMLGDGLNDAGALHQSDIGIVVTENTNNFTPACDAVLHANRFHQLPQFIEIAKAGVHIIYSSYIIALIYNIIGLNFAVRGTLSPLIAAILMPLSSVSIVLYGILMSNWVARRLKINTEK